MLFPDRLWNDVSMADLGAAPCIQHICTWATETFKVTGWEREAIVGI